MEMEDQYGMADLRQYMNGRPLFPPPGDLFSGHRNLPQAQQHPYEMVMVGRHHQVSATADMVVRGLHHHEFRSDSTTATTTTTTAASVGAASSASLNGLEMEGGGAGAGLGLGVDGGTGRWPRQETLTLLEVRSKLDCKFKEANQKGPLWDEVSRIMCEEHGYQRSGKKCREKFENLYKYYKKTKEGKAGRQDGKHYRFFRQLEALYGGDTTTPVAASETHLVGNNFRFHESSNNNTQANQECSFQNQPPPKLCHSLSLSNSSEFDTSSSSYDNDNNPGGFMDDDDSMEKMKKKKKKMRRSRRSWKAKIRDFIDSQMRKLMEKQEELLEKMIKALERKEQERMSREEEWRAQEAARIEREHKFWANERAWIEVRDAALMEALQKVTDKAVKASSPEVLMGAELRGETQNENGSETITSWPESETTKLIQLRNSMDSRFQQSGCSEEVLWEGIAAKMACLGYDRSGLMCKDKWDSINNFLRKTNKKRKENSKNCCYFQNSESVHNQGRAYCEINEQGPEITTRVAPNDNATATIAAAAATTMHDSCFRFLVGIEGDNLWDSYGVKLSKGENH